jgi:hypothetical protein
MELPHQIGISLIEGIPLLPYSAATARKEKQVVVARHNTLVCKSGDMIMNRT